MDFLKITKLTKVNKLLGVRRNIGGVGSSQHFSIIDEVDKITSGRGAGLAELNPTRWTKITGQQNCGSCFMRFEKVNKIEKSKKEGRLGKSGNLRIQKTEKMKGVED